MDTLHCFCLAIAFYLDHYKEGVGRCTNQNNIHYDIGISKVFGRMSQTHQFADYDYLRKGTKRIKDGHEGRVKDRNSRVLEYCKEELDEVVYWINRAIISS